MRKIIIPYLILLIFSVAYGCVSPETKIEIPKDVPVIKVAGTSDLDVDTNQLTLLKTIFLKTEGYASFLSSITRVYSDDDFLFIFDESQDKIARFSQDGTFLSVIQRIGRGPSEYISMMDFTIDKKRKQILALCDRPYKVMYFDYNGRFIKEVNIDGLYEEILIDKDFIYLKKAETENHQPNRYNIIILDQDFNIMHEKLPISQQPYNGSDILGNSLTKGKSSIHFSKRYDYSIYGLNRDSMSFKFNIDFEKSTLPEELKMEKPNFFENVRKGNYIFGIKNVVESDQKLMFQANDRMFVLNKKTRQLNGITTFYNRENALSFSYYLTIGNTDNILFYKTPAMLQSIADYAHEKKYVLDKNYVKLLGMVSENDNPILFLYKLK